MSAYLVVALGILAWIVIAIIVLVLCFAAKDPEEL